MVFEGFPCFSQGSSLGNCLDNSLSHIYVRDAARAADMVLQASFENIEMANYNVTGIPAVVSTGELETMIAILERSRDGSHNRRALRQ